MNHRQTFILEAAPRILSGILASKYDPSMERERTDRAIELAARIYDRVRARYGTEEGEPE